MDTINQQPINTKLRYLILALILISEIGCITLVANSTFSSGLLAAIFLACLFTGQIVILTHIALQNVPEKFKQLLLKAFMYSGAVLVLLGFVGACLILFPIARNDKDLLMVANIVLMLGLTLGIPLVIATTYEDISLKRKLATQESDQGDVSDDSQVALLIK